MANLRPADFAALTRAIEERNEPRRARSGQLIVSVPGGRYRTLVTADGDLTAAGTFFYDRTGQQQPQMGFEGRPTMRGTKETVKNRDGTHTVLRSWDGVERRWRFTKAGQRYYKDAKDRFVVRFPAVHVLVRHNNSLWIEETVVMSTATLLGEIEVPASWPEERQLQEVKRLAEEYIDAQPEATGLSDEERKIIGRDRTKILVPGSYENTLYNPSKPLEYNKQSFVNTEDGQMDIRVALHRPLRYQRPSWNFGFQGVMKEAYEESSACVVHQLKALVKQKGLFDVEDEMDRLYELLYDSFSMDNPYVLENEEGKLEKRGWREAGVTAAMIQQFAADFELACNVVWGQNKILSFLPEKRKGSLCLYIWGDHCFFIDDPDTKRVIGNIKERPVNKPPETVLRMRMQASEAPPAKDWVFFEGEPAPGHFWAMDLAEARAQLHRRGICPRVILSGLGKIKRLEVRIRDQKCVIHERDRDNLVCQSFAKAFAERLGRPFEYRGESLAAFAQMAFEELCKPPPRPQTAPETKRELSQRQAGLCAKCGGPCGRDFEVDHVVPRAVGGRDDLENLQILCQACHCEKTTFEALSFVEDQNPLLSRFCAETYEAFVESQKPPQAVANFAEADAKAVSIDLRRSRFNAFAELNAWDIPIFAPTDEIKPAIEGHLSDYNWIEIAPKPWRPSAVQMFPYFGPAWYGAATAAYLLDAGLALWSDFKLRFDASAHRPPAYVAERLKLLDEIWMASEEFQPELLAKRALLAMIGTWGSRERHIWHMITTSSPQDVPACSFWKSESPETPYEERTAVYHDYIFKQKILDLTSLRPLHQICLEGERLQLARIINLLNPKKVYRDLFSFRTDEVFCRVPQKYKDFKAKFQDLRFCDMTDLLPTGRKCIHQKASASEAPVFKCTKVDKPIYPGGQLKLLDAERPATQEPRWQILEEPLEGPDDFAQKIVDHVLAGKSCAVEGAAGTGKTEVLKRIEEALGPENVKKICFTHCGARNCGKGSSTTHHFVMKHILCGSWHGKAVLVDEISFVPLVLLAALEHLRMKGVAVICFGDFLQLPPVSNSWRGQPVSPELFQRSALYSTWADGTKFVLRRCRRSDEAHFQTYNQIRQMPLAEGLRLARTRYPPTTGEADWNICLSHHRRMQINARMQSAVAAKAERKLRVQGEIAYDLCLGTKLVGCNNELKRVVNGAFYLVTELAENGKAVTVLDEDLGESFELTLAQVAKHTRLRHALTTHSVQGRSLAGTIAVHDCDSKHFSPALLYVALSRAREGRMVSLA